jgi:hypothetical protein
LVSFAVYPANFGLSAGIHLRVAAIAVYRVTGKWLWSTGGREFPCSGQSAVSW